MKPVKVFFPRTLVELYAIYQLIGTSIEMCGIQGYITNSTLSARPDIPNVWEWEMTIGSTTFRGEVTGEEVPQVEPKTRYDRKDIV